MTPLRFRRHALATVLALVVTACSTGPELVDLGGRWTGTTVLPNAYSTTLDVVQSGSTISGTLTIAGVVNGLFSGTYHEVTRVLTWTLFDGCETWSGTLTVDGDGTGMSGPVLGDLSGCTPAGTNSSGTMTLTKQ